MTANKYPESIRRLPRVIQFKAGVKSHAYAHSADVILDQHGYVVKDKGGNPGRRPYDSELDECVLVTQEMANAERARIKRWANAMVDNMIRKIGKDGQA